MASYLLIGLKKLGMLKRLNLFLDYPGDKGMVEPLIRSIGYDHFFDRDLWMWKTLNKLLPLCAKDKSFIDVGANIGQTLLKVKSIKRNVPYFGFEPNPNCLFYLFQLMEVNNFENVTIFPFALSDKTGISDLDFYSTDATDTSASIVAKFRDAALQKIKVPTVCASELAQLYHQKIGVVKIDVEGGELEVVKGLYPLLQRDRPMVICEVLPAYNEENTLRVSRQRELGAILEDIQYGIAQIDSSGSYQRLKSFCVHSDIRKTNFLFYPAETKVDIQEKIGLIN